LSAFPFVRPVLPAGALFVLIYQESVLFLMEPEIPGFPGQLTDLSQWGNYILFTKQDGQKTKLPINACSGRIASVSNPADWTTFDLAMKRWKQEPRRIAGLAFVFLPGGGLTGIDLDHCRDRKTGSIGSDELEILRQVNSYAEFSPSRTGIHIIVQAQLPPGGRRRGNVELYDSGRFFTMTGAHLASTPFAVHSRQAEIDELHQRLFGSLHNAAAPRSVPLKRMDDQTLIQRILKSRQGEKFQRLLDGNITGYPSHSEADLALCAILAFWSQDSTQVERVFRSSRLYRPEKWEHVHSSSGLTYGQMTVRRALGHK